MISCFAVGARTTSAFNACQLRYLQVINVNELLIPAVMKSETVSILQNVLHRVAQLSFCFYKLHE